MKHLPTELIRTKRFAKAHSRDELHELIQAYSRDEIPDYQMSAWLMAVCLNGMTPEETAWLTMEMRDSGAVFDLKDLCPTVDKHSTGGIGDKTSLIVAPLVACFNVRVPMMAGRGLAHTGGTLDKLESISGFNVALSLKEFKSQLKSIGAAIIGQTKEICPADRKLYALRDVTGTVDSLPLICGSIMSKKLAEGADSLVLDVKFGSGAFMKTESAAESLAQALVNIAKAAGQNAVAIVSRMDEPLGKYIGNALEVKECLDILSGPLGQNSPHGYIDTRDLSIELAAHMLVLAGCFSDLNTARKEALNKLESGDALKKFREICSAQGGDLNASLARAKYTQTIYSPVDGFFSYQDVEQLGLAAVQLGAGRKRQGDLLDYSAGIEVFCSHGMPVKRGSPVFAVHTQSKDLADSALPYIEKSFTICDERPRRSQLITKVIR